MSQGIDNWKSLREACAEYGVEPLDLPALLQQVKHDAWEQGWKSGADDQKGWSGQDIPGSQALTLAENPYPVS
jgi:hypothetical protein